MAIQKKHGKGRLDKYYYLAKEKGYRARAAFKLIQLNKKYSFLQQSRCLLDLCAAPGSWLQVAAETMPVKSLIVGVDLSPIKPVPKTITFQGDITTDKTRSIIRAYLKSMKADCVIHDGAPNVGTAWVQDAFSQNELVLSSLKLACDFLAPGGTFVTKVFRSKDSAKLEWIFKQLFTRVEQTKPPSSRNVSAETFYVCRQYRAPKHLDPKFLDSKYAFAEVEDAKPNNEAKVFNPEKKKRKRDGYEEGDWTQFHEESASNFIQNADPIAMLGSLNKLHFRQEENGDIAQAALDKLPETTKEVRDCCTDLKVLGRKEFKLLLRWRLKCRERFGFRQKKGAHSKDDAGTNPDGITDKTAEGEAGEEVAVVEPMDEELQAQEDLQRMRDMQDKSKRKDRRRENERKQKAITRHQLHMTTPSEIGIEAGGPERGDATFRLKDVDRAGVTRQIARGRMHTAVEAPKQEAQELEESDDSDEDGDALETELDTMYETYRSRREDRDTKLRAKRIRKETNGEDDEEFDGFDNTEMAATDIDASSGDELMEDDDDDDDSSDKESGEGLLGGYEPNSKVSHGLTRRATNFFEQDIFKAIDGLDGGAVGSDSGVDVGDGEASPHVKATKDDEELVDEIALSTRAIPSNEKDEDQEIQEVISEEDEEEDWEETTTSKPSAGARPNIDIITAEAMTLAHQLATGKTSKTQLEDDNFNKYSHRDVDGLPDWFLDDEGKHSRPQRPVSAAAAAAIKEKQRALNARPIKKVREAKARKTLRAARRLEKLKKKTDGLVESGDMSEKDKASSIAKMISKAKKGGGKKKASVKVVKAGGANKGAGRPRGVKGKYKMVDSRLKKDVRAEKRLAKKIKGNR